MTEHESALLAAVSRLQPGTGNLTDADVMWRLFDAQATSRHLDAVARDLQQAGRGYYTIGSSGHESNAAVAEVLRPTDPALLHYRSGAFFLARAAQVPGTTPVRDILLGLMCSADEPIAGGRHKVFGHAALSVIPQTSTIASHLPRAVGLAMAIHRAKRLRVDAEQWPDDSVVVCSFGDASANHSTATGAVNTALNAAYRGLPIPLLLICEDNGLGISVPTPPGWIAAAYGSRPGLHYVEADGADPEAVLTAAAHAAEYVRAHRRPAFLHLKTVRFGGHAGSDPEITYRRPTDIAADYARDPILGTAACLVGAGAASATEIIERYRLRRTDVDAALAELGDVVPLQSAADVMAPLSPRRPLVAGEVADALADGHSMPSTLAESINHTLAAALGSEHGVILFGEDVGRKGGVYGVTRGLQRRFGSARVFDTVLDEQSILGLALGAGLAGLVPVPEIQYLAYLHNAEDQLRGEAATLSFFSRGQYRNPMVVRVAGLAYQKGFGGHFHNDNAVGVLRDIPGVVIACPARGDDAAAMLRTCLAAARVDGSVSVFLEPIALYHTRDLYADGDAQWLGIDPGGHVPIGHARMYDDGSGQADLVIMTFGNGVPMSLRAARRLAAHGVRARVMDLRWLAPLPVKDIRREALSAGRVLVADETRHAGGVGEGVLAALIDAGFTGAMARVSSRDSFVPLGSAARHVLLSEEDIEIAAVELIRGEHGDGDSPDSNGSGAAHLPALLDRFTHRRKEKRRDT